MRFVLPVVVFTSGAVVMIMELAASRIVAPYLGTSVIVWTSLIGVILAALSLGNWIGGRIADRYPSPQTLAGLLLSGSILIAMSTHFRWLLSAISTATDLQTAATIGVLALFGPATAVLGTIAPIAVKLSLLDISKTGRIVGRLYAISNAGSIAGTFLGGFVLISLVGSTNIIAILAITLFALAIVVLAATRTVPPRWMWAAAAALAAALMPSSGSIIFSSNEKLLADRDTRYSRTWVFDQDIGGQTVRAMSNSVGGYQSGMVVEYPERLLFPYVQMLDVFQAFTPAARNALMIGGAAYTYPRHFLAQEQSRRATVVEIDPGVTELAREYFGLTDDPRLTIAHEDARTFLNKSNEKFDLIIVDAFNSQLAIPFQLTTTEAVARIKESLADDGIVMVNIISALEGKSSGFLAAEYATYRQVFPSVKLYQVEPRDPAEYQNVILIASRQPLVPKPDSPYAAELDQKEWRGAIPERAPLTDDFAPVEWYTSSLI